MKLLRIQKFVCGNIVISELVHTINENQFAEKSETVSNCLIHISPIVSLIFYISFMQKERREPCSLMELI